MTAECGATPVGGPASSWEMLITEVRPIIISYARSRGISDAEDVAQDVFADVVERLPTFSGCQADLRSFVFTVAHRRIADRHRRIYRHAGLHMQSPPAVALPEDSIVDRDEASWALQSLAELDERSQRVLVLRFIEERGHAEIAQLLGVRETTARAIQSRALKRLRKSLERSRRNANRRAMAVIVAPLVRCFRRGHGHADTGPLGEWLADLRAAFGRLDATPAPLVGHAASGVTATSTLSASASASTVTAAATAAGGAPLVNVITAAVIAAVSAVAGTAPVMSTSAPQIEAASTATATTGDSAVTAPEVVVAAPTAVANGGDAPTTDTPTSVDVTTPMDLTAPAVDVVASTESDVSTATRDVPGATVAAVDAPVGTAIRGIGPTIETGVATVVQTPAQIVGDSPSADATVPMSPVGAPAAPELGIEPGAADAVAAPVAAPALVPPVAAPTTPELGIEPGADLADAAMAPTAGMDGDVPAAVSVANCGATVLAAACP